MKTVEVKMQMPEVPGYEYTGEYRQFKIGEYVADGDIVRQMDYNSLAQYPILRKIQKWKAVTVQEISELLSTQEVFTWKTVRGLNTVASDVRQGKVAQITWVAPAFYSITFQSGHRADLNDLRILEK